MVRLDVSTAQNRRHCARLCQSRNAKENLSSMVKTLRKTEKPERVPGKKTNKSFQDMLS